jgi:hypothetical protein
MSNMRELGERIFFLTLVAGILFLKNHKNPPMEAKK